MKRKKEEEIKCINAINKDAKKNVRQSRRNIEFQPLRRSKLLLKIVSGKQKILKGLDDSFTKIEQ